MATIVRQRSQFRESALKPIKNESDMRSKRKRKRVRMKMSFLSNATFKE